MNRLLRQFISRETPITAQTILEWHGFRLLGEITARPDCHPIFPESPVGAGLLAFACAGGWYVGVTEDYSRRFREFGKPADDVWTEAVIGEMLRAGGGKVWVRPLKQSMHYQRIAMQRVVLQEWREAAVVVWNKGRGHSADLYAPWKLDAVARQLAEAVERYQDRQSDERRKRIASLLYAMHAAQRPAGVEVNDDEAVGL